LRLLDRALQSRCDVMRSNAPAVGQHQSVLVGHDLRHAVLLELLTDLGAGTLIHR